MGRDVSTEVVGTIKTITIAQDVWRKLQIYALLKNESITNLATDLLDRALDGKKAEVQQLMKNYDF